MELWLLSTVMVVVVMMVCAPVASVTQVSPCRLRFDNGSEINLMMVAPAPQDAPRFQDCTADNQSDSSTYSYNPCYSYVHPKEGVEMACSKDVAVCQASTIGYFNVGKQSSAEFQLDNSTHKWSILYNNPIGDRQTIVTLKCSNNTSDSLTVWGEMPGQHKSVYNLTLVSRCACVDGCGVPILPQGMSLGSFLLLLLLLLVIAYLLSGYVYRRFVIGARGLELFPHLGFWKEFPLLVQDGFLYLIKCGQIEMTYERI